MANIDSGMMSQLNEYLANGQIDSDQYNTFITNRTNHVWAMDWDNHNRSIRNTLLFETDHWAYQDTADMTSAQITYRQALRDITTHANWPNLEDTDWPTKPAG